MMDKPTLGIEPANIWEEDNLKKRISDILRAIRSRVESNQPPDIRWAEELVERLKELQCLRSL